MSGYDFDVALSFAGEDRAYVHEVAVELLDQGIAVFYDQFEMVELWGLDVSEHLDDVYRNRSRYAVVFTSRHYARKMWTSYERQVIQARAIREKGAFVLPVRLDDTDIPGVTPTTGFLDGTALDARQVAALIVAKVSRDTSTGPDITVPLGVPSTVEAKQRIVSLRPAGWEYLLLSGVIWQSAARLSLQRLDHEMRYAPSSGQHISGETMDDFLRTCLDELATITAKLEALFTADRLAWALGGPGQPGDATRIEHLGLRFGDAYHELLDWSAAIRGTAAGQEHRRVIELVAQLAERPVRRTQRFVDELVLAAGRVAVACAAGEETDLRVPVELTLPLDEQLLAEFTAERESWQTESRQTDGRQTESRNTDGGSR